MPNVVGSIPMAMSERFSLQHRIDNLHEALHEAQADLTKCKLERIDLDAALADVLARYSGLEALCHDLVAAYGTNAIDFHRSVARIRQALEGEP